MKEFVESGKAHNCLNSDDSIKKYPKIFSIALALTFIALIAFAAFLVSDILSLESNSLNTGPFNVFSILNPLGSGAVTKDLQDEVANITDHGKDQELNSTLKNESAMENNTSSSNKSTAINKAAKQAVVVRSFSRSSDGDSHRSSNKKKQVSSKSSTFGTQGDASPSNAAVENRSWSSQASDHNNLSDNLTLNLSTSAPKMNMTERLANLSNSTSVPSTSMPINSVPESDLTPDSASPAESNSSELNPVDNETDNETSNWVTGPDFVPGNTTDSMNISDELAGSYSIPSESGSKIVTGDKSASQLRGSKGKENKRISNRSKYTKMKSLKKSTPRAKLVKTRPARPARDKSTARDRSIARDRSRR